MPDPALCLQHLEKKWPFDPKMYYISYCYNLELKWILDIYNMIYTICLTFKRHIWFPKYSPPVAILGRTLFACNSSRICLCQLCTSGFCYLCSDLFTFHQVGRWHCVNSICRVCLSLSCWKVNLLPSLKFLQTGRDWLSWIWATLSSTPAIFPVPGDGKTSTQRDATSTMLHCGDGVLRVMSIVRRINSASFQGQMYLYWDNMTLSLHTGEPCWMN